MNNARLNDGGRQPKRQRWLGNAKLQDNLLLQCAWTLQLEPQDQLAVLYPRSVSYQMAAALNPTPCSDPKPLQGRPHGSLDGAKLMMLDI